VATTAITPDFSTEIRMKGSLGGAAAMVAISLVTFTTPAASQEAQSDEQAWSFNVGGGAMYRPDYEGSDDYEVRGLPVIGINYRDIFMLRGGALMLDMVQLSGTGVAENFSFGPLVKFDQGREADDNPILRNLGDIDQGALAGVFVGYELGPVALELTVAQDATSRYEGLIAEIQAGYGFMLTQRLRGQIQVSSTWTNDDYTQAYFGITRDQARASGLREFTAEAGVKDAGASLSLNYLLTEHWRVTGRLAYRRLLGDAADSPLVEDEGSASQASAALLVSYQF
jgi:outer membrane scaffolding protein for murein synthesis (MipA/OmpV family)